MGKKAVLANKPNTVVPKLSPIASSEKGKAMAKTKGSKQTLQTRTVTPFKESKQVLPQIKTMVERFDTMIQGDMSDLPDKPPSEVRIFLSSTFSDMRVERNWLTKVACPKIKDYCAANLDLDFQLVDLRWGITDDATNDHVTEKLCVAEIENCQRVSLGPNFVVVLGQRYGFRPIPTEVAVAEFEILLEEVRLLEGYDPEMLTTWYQRDDNAVPAVYVLQPISAQLPGFINLCDATAQNAAKVTWWETQGALQGMLREAATHAAEKNKISPERKHAYFRSVTEEEIQKGLFDAKNPSDHVICFTRTLEGLDQPTLHDADAARHIDNAKGPGGEVIDQEVEILRTELQQKKIPSKLPSANIYKMKVPWQPGGVNPEKYPDHRSYVESFCADFSSSVVKMVEEGKDARDRRIPVSEYYTDFDELLHHLHFCRSKCATFKGQADILGWVKALLEDPKTRAPLVVYADSGVGKTSVMARLFQLLPTWFGPGCVRVIRFLGTSSLSTEIYDVMFGVLGQLADDVDKILEPVGYQSYRRLVDYLPRFLRNVSRATKEHVFILLDSVDQLDAGDAAHDMKWLPTSLPPNVHIILSMLPVTHGCLDNAKKMLTDAKCFLHVEPLPLDTGEEIIDTYLKSRGRDLTPEQRGVIIAMLEKTPSPLFLKLVLDQAVEWKSYTPSAGIASAMGGTVREAIDKLFQRMETKFGLTLVSRALGYLTVGLNGLSEVELEDILSCDDDVLNEVYQYHNPPVEGVVRLPRLLWTRIRHELREYLVERQTHGKNTIYWYHRQFTEAARDRYVPDEERHQLLHGNIAALFRAESGVQKTVELKRRRLVVKDADRQITPQPLIPRNKRKLQALPYHLIRTGNVELMKEAVFCNLKFLLTKIKGLSLAMIGKDLASALAEVMPIDQELLLLHDCVAEIKSSFRSAHLVPMEMVARLPHDAERLPHISRLVGQCKTYIRDSGEACLLPLYPCLNDGDPLVHTVSDCEQLLAKAGNTLLVQCSPAAGCVAGSGTVYVINCASRTSQDVSKLWIDRNLPPPSLSDEGKHIFAWASKQTTAKTSSGRTQTNAPPVSLVKVRADSLETSMEWSVHFTKGETVGVYGISEDCHLLAVAVSVTRVSLFKLLDGKVKPGKDGASREAIAAKMLGGFEIELPKLRSIIEDQQCVTKLIATPTHVIALCHTLDGTADHQSQVHTFDVVSKTSKNMTLPGSIQHDQVNHESSNSARLTACVVTQSSNTKRLISLDCRTLEYDTKVEKGAGCSIYVTGDMVCYSEKDTLTLGRAGGFTKEYILPVGGALSSVTGDENSGVLCAGTTEGTIYIYHRGERAPVRTIQVGSSIREVHLGSGAEDLMVFGGDKKLNVYDLKMYERGSGRGLQNEAQKASIEHATDVVTSAFCPDGTMLWTLHPNGTARCWNVESGLLQSELETGVQSHDLGDKLAVIGVPGGGSDGKGIVGAHGNRLVVFHSTKETLGVVDTERKPPQRVGSVTNVVCFAVARDRFSACVLKRASGVGKDKFLVSTVMFIDCTERRVRPIKESLVATRFSASLSDDERFLVLGMTCGKKELDIILQTEKKNNLPASTGNLKFAAVELGAVESSASTPSATASSSSSSSSSSVRLVPCYRKLSRVPTLGTSWAVGADSSVVIGRQRTVVVWDMAAGPDKCDQKMAQGSKIPQFYRPQWVEGEAAFTPNPPNWCHGNTSAIARTVCGDVIAMGSEDGFLLVYNVRTGLSVAGAVGKKPNHGQSVALVAVSPGGRWVASYSEDRMLKAWDVRDKCREVFSLRLTVAVRVLEFSPGDHYLAVIGDKPTGISKTLLFQLIDRKGV